MSVSDPNKLIVFDDVSKFYGEILGVNRVSLSIEPGITSLVGPNGSGKTTLMNLLAGLIRPTRGKLSVLGIAPNDSEHLFSKLGYCSQFDSFPRGMTGFEFIRSYLLVHGFNKVDAEQFAWKALERVGMVQPGNRKISAYSKGMRQRVRLAQAIAHRPSIIILDEPLNGLDPLVRAESMRLFRQLADEGMHLIISSHILHEVDLISDRVILLNNGYIVAKGEVQDVRDEMDDDHPMQVFIRCDNPAKLASRVFEADSVVEASLHRDGGGLLIKTRNPDSFYLQLNQIVADGSLTLEMITPTDDNLNAVYNYLIGTREEGR